MGKAAKSPQMQSFGLRNRKSAGGKVSITTGLSGFAMERFTDCAGGAAACGSVHNKRSWSGAIEYGLMAMLIVTVVSTGATLLDSRLSGVFGAVAGVMEQAGGSAIEHHRRGMAEGRLTP
jgi:Flp pilus assembly pilin Flp